MKTCVQAGLMLVALVSGASLAQSPAECVPACRDGYLCHQGRCISACNPPCAATERCTGSGQCVGAAPPRAPEGAESATVPSARVYQLEQERIDVSASKRGFGLPITLTAVGLAVGAVGTFFIFVGVASLGRSSEAFIAGFSIDVLALPPLIIGLVFFFKVSQWRDETDERVKVIDQELARLRGAT